MARGDEATARARRAEAGAAGRGEFGGRRGAARGSRDRVRWGQAAGCCWLRIGRERSGGSAFGSGALRRSGAIRRGAGHAGNGNALVEFRASRVRARGGVGKVVWCAVLCWHGDLACCAAPPRRVIVSAYGRRRWAAGLRPLGLVGSCRLGLMWAARSSRPHPIWAGVCSDKLCAGEFGGTWCPIISLVGLLLSDWALPVRRPVSEPGESEDCPGSSSNK